MKKNKFNATKVLIDKTTGFPIVEEDMEVIPKENRLYLDSKFEYYCYERLLKHFPPHIIQIHSSIQVFSDNHFFNSKTWNSDFMVNYSKSQRLIIEAKGYITREFIWMVRCLALGNPAVIRDLVIVSSNPSLLRRRMGCTCLVKIISLQQVSSFLHQLLYH